MSLTAKRNGRPIGMHFMACLATVVMKQWELAWMDSMEIEKLQIALYESYVDDSSNFLRPFTPGWRWNAGFEYRQE